MNKTIEEEELDRELVLRHDRSTYRNGQQHDDILKAKIGRKSLVFQALKNWRNESIKFSKTTYANKNELEIELRWAVEEKARCSLGHDHVVKTESNKYTWIRIPWRHIDSLIEWLNDGNWTEVSSREPTERRLLREAAELLNELAKKHEIYGPACAKLRNKINNHILPHRKDLLESHENSGKIVTT